MTLQRLSGFPGQKPLAFAPTQDGPSATITFPNAAPGWRRIVAAEGDLSGAQSDTIKYLLETTAASNTNGIARTVKLYTYNVETNVLTYLHTITGLPNAFTPDNNYSDTFWVNVAAGYYIFETNQAIYVMGLADGAIWSNSGLLGGGSSHAIREWSTVPHPTNNAIFNLVYSTSSGSPNYYRTTTFRQVTVNTVAKTVNWGSATSYGYSAYSYGGNPIPDTRSTANSGDWIIGRTFATGSAGGLNPLILNPTTGVMTAAPYAPAIGASNAFSESSISFLQGDNIILNVSGTTNMQMYSCNPWVNGSYTALPTWGAAGTALGASFGCVPYFDPDGKFGKYVVYTDTNMDVWVTKVAFASIGAGSFGTALFRASTVVTGITPAPTNVGKPITPCKYGFFYVGQMNTTTTAAPVIWYPLKPNLP